MNWEEAIQLYVDYEATVLSDSKKTALEKAKERESHIRDLLSKMPNLVSKTIENIAPEVWMDSLKTYMKKDRYHDNWTDLEKWKKYVESFDNLAP